MLTLKKRPSIMTTWALRWDAESFLGWMMSLVRTLRMRWMQGSSVTTTTTRQAGNFTWQAWAARGLQASRADDWSIAALWTLPKSALASCSEPGGPAPAVAPLLCRRAKSSFKKFRRHEFCEHSTSLIPTTKFPNHHHQLHFFSPVPVRARQSQSSTCLSLFFPRRAQGTQIFLSLLISSRNGNPGR